MNLNIRVDALAPMLFLRNPHNVPIDLTLGNLSNTKDFFFFLVDLFCKGLILTVHGRVGGRVVIDDVTQEQIAHICEKLHCAGIKTEVDVQPNDRSNPRAPPINFADILRQPDNLPLNQYCMVVTSDTFVYKVRFDVFHNV